uniref:Uncharacterized protein n=1 Tax=Salix viminalis TaxID=40686 RepID=A0A6N2MBN3_SALVM
MAEISELANRHPVLSTVEALCWHMHVAAFYTVVFICISELNWFFVYIFGILDAGP